MKNTLIALCLFAAAGAAFALQPSTAEADAAASKAAAEGIAAVMRGTSPVITGGEIQRNGNSPVMELNNSKSGGDKMDYFKDLTGLAGAVTTGSGRDGTLGARASTATYVDFSCKTEPHARKATGGYVVQLEGCSLSGNVVSSVSLRLCSALVRGGSCSEPTAFSEKTNVPANAYASIADVKLAMGCNDTNGACRLTVTGSYDMTTNVTDFDKTVQQKNAAMGSDENTALGAIVAMRTKQTADGKNAYDETMATHGQPMVACVQANSNSTNVGASATTCDGTKSVTVNMDTKTPAQNCSQAAQCVRTATRTTSFARNCQRTFPLTANVCNFTTATKSCDVSVTPVRTAAGDTLPDLVQSSCIPEDIEGASKIGGQDTKVCESALDAAGLPCVTKRTDFYAWPPVKVGQCQGSPYTVGGSCVTDAAHAQSQCTSNKWFGRTKTALECVIVNMADPNSLPLEVDGSVVAGCGVCEASQTGTTCYAATPLAWGNPSEQDALPALDTCSGMNLTGCSLVNTEQVGADETGMVTSQRENYTCTREAETCLEYKQAPGCEAITVSNYGLDRAGFRAPASSDALNQALGAAAVANGLGGAVADANGNTVLPLLFSGTVGQCVQPTGAWGSNGLYLDCCQIGLSRPGGKFGKLNKCSEGEARLAAARRANYTVRLGDFCSSRLPWPLRTCTRKTQGFCSFPGILPRIIQEQGRKQLDAIVAQGSMGSIERATLSFNYYGSTGNWSNPVNVNGTTVAAWQWPAYCSDLALAQKTLGADPSAKECPGQLQTYFAVCEKTTGCGPLPEYPELGALNWVLTAADPLKKATTAVSRYAVVSGACQPSSGPTGGQCAYEISAWPAGVGGRAVVSKQVQFPVYVAGAGATTPGEVSGDLSNVGDYMFRPVSTGVNATAYPTALPATVRLNFSSDGGQTWSPLDIPATDNNELSLPGTDATLSGGCSMETNLCNFKMTGTASVTSLSWGTPENPNCKGFTTGQISALDFSKLDLSEWLATVAGTLTSGPASGVSAIATAQMKSFDAAFQAGDPITIEQAAPQGVQIARVLPAEGFGPFTATLKVGGYWPATYGDPLKDTNAVTGVSIDWGDCSAPEQGTFISEINGQPARGFLAQHVFINPENVPLPCGNSSNQPNLTHKVKLGVMTTKTGLQPVELEVKNAFDTMPGAYSSNKGNTVNNTPVNSAVIPSTK